jgi:hypothetical protein
MADERRCNKNHDSAAHLLAPTVGSRISAAHLPQGRCLTPRYVLFFPLAMTWSGGTPVGIMGSGPAFCGCGGKLSGLHNMRVMHSTGACGAGLVLCLMSNSMSQNPSAHTRMWRKDAEITMQHSAKAAKPAAHSGLLQQELTRHANGVRTDSCGCFLRGRRMLQSGEVSFQGDLLEALINEKNYMPDFRTSRHTYWSSALLLLLILWGCQ